MNLASAVPVIAYRSQFVQAAAWVLLAVVLLAAAVGAMGWIYGYRHADALGQAALAQLRTDHAIERAESIKRAANRYQTQVEQGNRLAQRVIGLMVDVEQAKQLRNRRSNDVSALYQPEPGADLITSPRCVLTRGWVRDYNAAFGLPGAESATDTGTADPASPATTSPTTGLLADDFEDSGVSLVDIRRHTEDVASWCRTGMAQRDALIEYLTGHP